MSEISHFFSKTCIIPDLTNENKVVLSWFVPNLSMREAQTR